MTAQPQTQNTSAGGTSTQARNPWAAVRRTLFATLPLLATLAGFLGDWAPRFIAASGLDKTAIGGAALFYRPRFDLG